MFFSIAIIAIRHIGLLWITSYVTYIMSFTHDEFKGNTFICNIVEIRILTVKGVQSTLCTE